MSRPYRGRPYQRRPGPDPAERQLQRAADRGQRGAQLVRDQRHKLGLHSFDLALARDVAEDQQAAEQLLLLVDHRRGEALEQAWLGAQHPEILNGAARRRRRRRPRRSW